MKIAVISDIHANYQALEAVMKDIKQEHCDKIFCLGDLAMAGPQPGLVIDFVRKQTDWTVIQGNTDKLIAEYTEQTYEDVKKMYPMMANALRDDVKILPADKKEYLKNFPSEDIFIVGGAMFYSTMIDYCDRAYITKVDADGGATHFFKNLDEILSWEIKEQSEEIETGGYKIKFTVYKNREPKKFF